MASTSERSNAEIASLLATSGKGLVAATVLTGKAMSGAIHVGATAAHYAAKAGWSEASPPSRLDAICCLPFSLGLRMRSDISLTCFPSILLPLSALVAGPATHAARAIGAGTKAFAKELLQPHKTTTHIYLPAAAQNPAYVAGGGGGGGAGHGQQFYVVVPEGCGPGSQIMVQTPSGVHAMVTVPPGYQAGQQFLASL